MRQASILHVHPPGTWTSSRSDIPAAACHKRLHSGIVRRCSRAWEVYTVPRSYTHLSSIFPANSEPLSFSVIVVMTLTPRKPAGHPLWGQFNTVTMLWVNFFVNGFVERMRSRHPFIGREFCMASTILPATAVHEGCSRPRSGSSPAPHHGVFTDQLVIHAFCRMEEFSSALHKSHIIHPLLWNPAAIIHF